MASKLIKKELISRKVTYLNIDGRRFRYTETIEEIVPEIIDLTKEDHDIPPPPTFSPNPSMESPSSPTYWPREYVDSSRLNQH